MRGGRGGETWMGAGPAESGGKRERQPEGFGGEISSSWSGWGFNCDGSVLHSLHRSSCVLR